MLAKITAVSRSMVVVVYALCTVLLVAGLQGTAAWLLLGLFAVLALVVLAAPFWERGSARISQAADPWAREWRQIWRRPVC